MDYAEHVYSKKRFIIIFKNNICDNMFTLIIADKKLEKQIPNNDYKIINLLKELDMPVETVVTKKNNKIVIEETLIEDDDEIEIIQVIYGG